MKVLLFISILYIISCFPKEDRVVKLPDYPSDAVLYSGYLKLGKTDKHFFYIFVQAETDYEKKPVVLWLNGGPGCSSLGGFSVENGPAVVKDGTTYFTLNPYSWHKKANMLYIESPSGVGFSYSDNGSTTSDDVSTGNDNLLAVINFFEKFEELRSHEFFISGESYAGIYVPYLTYNIIQYNKFVENDKKINLKGMMIGDGVTDWTYDVDPARREYDYTHNLYSTDIHNQFLKNCLDQNSEACSNSKKTISLMTRNVDVYHIYKKCGKEPTTLSEKRVPFKQTNYYKKAKWFWDRMKIDFDSFPPNYNCPIDTYSTQPYFNRRDVQEALHINKDKLGMFWTDCGNINYDPNNLSVGSLYLYPAIINAGIRAQFYSGDADSCVPFNGSFKWIEQLALPIKKNWRPWRIFEDRNSGFVIEYQGLNFVSVQGTGHMVAEWKPKEAQHILDAFINDFEI